MRKLVLTLLVLLLAVPAVGGAAMLRMAGDGTLSVEDGDGRVIVAAKGGVIGRFDRGSVVVYDKTPNDAFEPKVWGATRVVTVGEAGERYVGTNVRFRVIGGEFRIVVEGNGVDVSAVGSGRVFLEGVGRSPGVYSLDGADCGSPRAKCKELPPDPGKWLQLGDDSVDRSSSRRQP